MTANKESTPEASLSLEVVLYALVVLLAVWLRFARLDLHPLTNHEAEHALAASTSEFASDSPAHGALTSLVFAVGGESESTARLIPALAGIGLILTPVLLRRQIGRGPAFLGTLLLTLSPVLWAASRTADGTSLAALGITTAIFLLIGGHLEWSAAFLGLAVVSGPVALTGLISIGAGAGVFTLLRRRSTATLDYPIRTDHPWIKGLGIVVLVALVVASGIGFFPDSLQSIFDGLGSWVGGWFQSSGIAAVTLTVMLLIYEPLVFAAGGAGLFSRFRRGSSVLPFMASWTVGAVLILFIYRGRQAADIIWTVIPLTILASSVISYLLDRVFQPESIWIAVGFTGAVVALLAFAYLQVRAGVSGPETLQSLLGIPTHFAAAGMGVGLAVLALILLAIGWSRQIAFPIAAAALILTGLVITISVGAALNFGEPTARELYRPQASTRGLTALRDMLRTLSRAETGRPDALPIEVRDRPSPALAWTLREYPKFEGPVDAPVVITREGGELPGEYLGQSMTIGETWGWIGWLPPDFLRWQIIREAPILPDRWVLLVRKDVAGVEEISPVEFEQ
ncbi:MAG: hypothetical protein ACE5JF_01405 [Anaerolineales bacterium]